MLDTACHARCLTLVERLIATIVPLSYAHDIPRCFGRPESNGFLVASPQAIKTIPRASPSSSTHSTRDDATLNNGPDQTSSSATRENALGVSPTISLAFNMHPIQS